MKKILLFLFFLNTFLFCNDNKMIEKLTELRSMIQENRKIDALNYIDKMMLDTILTNTKNLNYMEDFYWQAAMTYLDFANELENVKEYKKYASHAYEKWDNYIKWYDSLTKEEKLSISKSHIRIKKASAHLANSAIRMGEPYKIFDYFYNIKDINYLGVDAIALWKHWLYSCPDKRHKKRTFKERKKLICNAECAESWINYAYTLDEWADEENLRKAVRKTKKKEAKQIQIQYDKCWNQL